MVVGELISTGKKQSVCPVSSDVSVVATPVHVLAARRGGDLVMGRIGRLDAPLCLCSRVKPEKGQRLQGHRQTETKVEHQQGTAGCRPWDPCQRPRRFARFREISRDFEKSAGGEAPLLAL
jgi:hypothetical protein